jgi:DNA-binding LytR/AlgR family response regulator
MRPFGCVIVENSVTDRALTEKLLFSYPSIRIVGSYSHLVECLEIFKTTNISILLSDIDSQRTILTFLRALEKPPLSILFTESPESAIEAFDVGATDCILKPVKTERLDKAIRHAMNILTNKAKALLYDMTLKKNYLMIKDGSVANKVNVSDIIYLEALTNYTKVITYSRKYIALRNLKNFMKILPSGNFLRIHRSYAVAIDKISCIDSNGLFVERQRLPLGKAYRDNVRRLVLPTSSLAV